MGVVAPAPDLLAELRGRGRIRGSVALLGPAFVASVASIDPGNFATNITAGAKVGWCGVGGLVAATWWGRVVHCLSAKVGVPTGRDLAELCREHLPAPVT